MRLVCNIPRRVQIRRVDEDQVRQISRDPRGGFNSDPSWTINYDERIREEVLTITFSPIILINSNLDVATAQSVETHERRHFNDFLSIANTMKNAIQQVIRNGSDPQIQARMEWFNYDCCRASENYHRSIPDWTIRSCFRPNSTRP